jgi:hypothetical protein
MERNAVNSMTERRPRRRIGGLALVVLLVLAQTGGAIAQARQATAPMEATCIGRFLIDAPLVPATQSAYIHAGKRIATTQPVSRTDFQQTLAAREAALRDGRHRAGGAMWVGGTALDADAVVQTSWLSDSSRAGQLQELYVLDPVHQVMFLISGQTDATRRPAAIENLRALRPRIHHRDPAALPAGPGFCVDSGFIDGARINTEELTAALQVPNRVGTRVSVMSRVVGRADVGLLQRAAALPAGTQRLRAGRRNVDGLAGEELLVRSGDRDGGGYRFLWEFQGEPESLQRPFLSLQLSTEAAQAFATDEEALQVWDQLLGSLRLRAEAN